MNIGKYEVKHTCSGLDACSEKNWVDLRHVPLSTLWAPCRQEVKANVGIYMAWLSIEGVSSSEPIWDWEKIFFLLDSRRFINSLPSHCWLLKITEQGLQWPHTTRNIILAKNILEKSLNTWETITSTINNSKPCGRGRTWFPELLPYNIQHTQILSKITRCTKKLEGMAHSQEKRN